MTTFNIEIDDRGVLDAFNRLQSAARDLSPAMEAIAGLLESRTAENFANQSGPSGPWPALKSQPRNKKRTRAQILVDVGTLKRSITSAFGADFATVGTNVVYAAIHQLGGEAGRGRKVHIPARPFLPFTGEPDSGSGKLQPESEEAILDIVLGHLKRAAGV